MDSTIEFTYAIEYNRVRINALEQARAGTLTRGWRTELPKRAEEPGTPIAEALDRVVQAITDMPPEAWEPGCAADWRRALDAWYAASQEALVWRFTNYLDGHAQVLRSTTEYLDSQMPRVEPQNPDGDNPWAGVAGKYQLARDSELFFATANYVQERDWVTASYLAGLTAGGVEGIDWREWLVERAQHWYDDKRFANQVHRESKTPRGRHRLDMPLPAYWSVSSDDFSGDDCSVDDEPPVPRPTLRLVPRIASE